MYRIRPANPNDAQGIAKVHYETWQSDYRGLMPDALLDQMTLSGRLELRKMIFATGRSSCVIAETEAGEVVGFVDFGPSREFQGASGEIYAIYIDRNHQRLGIGRDLMRAAAEGLAEHETACVWALESNAKACNFYQKTGARSAARESREKAGFSLSEICFVWDDLSILRAV